MRRKNERTDYSIEDLAKWDAEHRKLLETVPDNFDVLHYAAIAVLKRKDKRVE